jgi:hypothetical protein
MNEIRKERNRNAISSNITIIKFIKYDSDEVREYMYIYTQTA